MISNKITPWNELSHNIHYSSTINLYSRDNLGHLRTRSESICLPKISLNLVKSPSIACKIIPKMKYPQVLSGKCNRFFTKRPSVKMDFSRKESVMLKSFYQQDFRMKLISVESIKERRFSRNRKRIEEKVFSWSYKNQFAVIDSNGESNKKVSRRKFI